LIQDGLDLPRSACKQQSLYYPFVVFVAFRLLEVPDQGQVQRGVALEVLRV
jgi:hypothetical protein